ncbi:RNA exonuclease 4-like [Pyrus ussuriensis x Pyrus communis]|uniref:RNA exonuclease 4-like n=1 Tax=Pyrus ussuriensis x Pyrus communis TaxID=2448454 RepID=A0A5N5FJ30_9ROSA|nr:RNA exonuclease 4-like [Pyrus ussuriensis x Pyrus communis]
MHNSNWFRWLIYQKNSLGVNFNWDDSSDGQTSIYPINNTSSLYLFFIFCLFAANISLLVGVGSKNRKPKKTDNRTGPRPKKTEPKLSNRIEPNLTSSVNRWGNVVYDEFVRPVECVVDFRTEISGIRPRDLRKGSRRALRRLVAEFLDIKIQNGEHCPIEDARAAMVLYQKNRKAWEKRVKDQIKLKQKQKKCKPKRKRAKGDELEIDDAETES